MKKKFANIITIIFFACLMSAGCGHGQPISKSGFYFDTIISVTLYDSSKSKELEHCFELADLYEHYFSTELADSDVSKINASGGRPVSVHDETLELLEKGLTYSKLSGGKFDITIGKLTDLWDFQANTPALPDAAAVKDAAAAVDYRKVTVNGHEVSLKDADTAIDLGGIAKGYIADQMKAYLQSQGIKNGFINLGGNVLALGTKTNGDAYTIGIQKPFAQAGEVMASVQIKDQTVVTSGTYERYFKQDGKLYHHILNTDTGYPYENGLASVSIICSHSADGDGLSTVCFALGLEKGLELIESLDDTEAIFVTEDLKMHCSSGIGKNIPMQAVQ